MAKVFLGIMLALLAWAVWVTAPRAMMRTCPVCQGTGYLPLDKPVYFAKGKTWFKETSMLCPFCNQGKISLYDLRLHQTEMLKWMVKQRLPPQVLIQRVRAGFGQSGLNELDRDKFFMDDASLSHGS